jgi:hypothetical protein
LKGPNDGKWVKWADERWERRVAKAGMSKAGIKGGKKYWQRAWWQVNRWLVESRQINKWQGGEQTGSNGLVVGRTSGSYGLGG